MKKSRLLALVALVLAFAAFGVANTAIDTDYWIELEPSETPRIAYAEVPRYYDEHVFSRADYIFEGRVKASTDMAYYWTADGRTIGPSHYTKYDVELLDCVFTSNITPAQESEVVIYGYGNSYAKIDMAISINVGDTYIFIAGAILDNNFYRDAGIYTVNDLYGVYPVEESTVYLWHEVPIGDMESPLLDITEYKNHPPNLGPSHRAVDRETAKEGLRVLAETYNAGGTQ